MPFSNQGKQKLLPYFGPLALFTVLKPNSMIFHKNDNYENQIAKESR
jgi:hypothetical protein